MNAPVAPARILRHDNGSDTPADDILATEEPLEIRLGHGPLDDRKELSLSVTMRTPGNDQELALGFLFTEGLIGTPEEVLRVEHCSSVKPEELGNVVRVELRPDVALDPARWQRNFYTSSSCGVCGKSSIDAVKVQCNKAIVSWGPVDPAVITALPDRMREAQTVFRHTGGIHAAALFDRAGKLILLREDIGRHNAVDKVIGAALRVIPDFLSGVEAYQLLVSGRAGFELVQKCVVAGIPLMAAVGAPSSIGVELARTSGLTLIGFLRGPKYNLYAPVE